MKARDNPFRSSSVEQIRYALASDALDALADHALREPCSCVLGPQGTGKTTLLEDLEPILAQRGLHIHWVHLNLQSTAEQRSKALSDIQALGPEQICLFDGAEVLNRWQWQRACHSVRNNGAHLIATLHRRRGVPVLHHTKPDWLLMAQFVQQLAGEHFDESLLQQAQHAFDTHAGNMREVFRICYLCLAARTT